MVTTVMANVKNEDISFDHETPEENFNPQTPLQMDDEAEAQLTSFCELLDSLYMDNRLKLLWKQIYRNAVLDRKNSLMVWSDLYIHVHTHAEMHALHGDRLAKYMERLEKSNAQLIKLAELVQKVKSEQDSADIPTGNDLFDQLSKARHK